MKIITQHINVSYEFPVVFGRNLFHPDDLTISEILAASKGKRNRILPIIDSNVVEAIERYLAEQ